MVTMFDVGGHQLANTTARKIEYYLWERNKAAKRCGFSNGFYFDKNEPLVLCSGRQKGPNGVPVSPKHSAPRPICSTSPARLSSGVKKVNTHICLTAIWQMYTN